MTLPLARPFPKGAHDARLVLAPPKAFGGYAPRAPVCPKLLRGLWQEAAAGLLHLPAGAMPQAPQKNAASFAMLVVHALWQTSTSFCALRHEPTALPLVRPFP